MREIDFRNELGQLMWQEQNGRHNMVESDEFPVDDAAADRFLNAVW